MRSTNPSAQPRTCQDVDFTVTGGVPPYTVTTAVSMDNAINQTFTNSNISVKNVLTGGATYILALSDSTGSYAASSDLIYSGGGGDNSCLVTTPSTSSRPTKSATPDKGSSSSKGPAIIGSVVAICAVLLIAALVAFLMYRRKKKAQHQAFLAGRMNGMNGGGGYGPHGSDSDNGTYISSAYGSGREKFVSPMGSNSHNSGIAGLGGAAAGGGMWRPESPTEYPGITSAPVRFRVTNPDDDARSERSFKMLNGSTASTRAGLNGSSMRPSQDTVRSGSTGLPWRRASSDGRSTNDRSQRQSLIESDANALYPPTSSYNTARGGGRGGSLSGNGVKSPNSARLRLDTSNTSNGSSGSFEDADQPWPTYSSAASSETEDHYTDLPASSAGILGLHRGRIVSSSSSNMNTSISRNGAERTSTSRRRGTGSDEMDLEEMYRDEVYSSTRESENEEIASNSGFDHDPSWESFTRPSPHSQGMTPSPSNAYGSPFADSQRVRS